MLPTITSIEPAPGNMRVGSLMERATLRGWRSGCQRGNGAESPLRQRRGRIHAALAEQLADLRLHEVDRDLVVAAARDDDVGEALAGLHELQVHGPDAVLVLAQD